MPGLECHLRYGSKDNGETFMKGKDNWKKQKECHRVWKLLKKNLIQIQNFKKQRFESQIFIFERRNFQHNGCEEQEAGEREKNDLKDEMVPAPPVFFLSSLLLLQCRIQHFFGSIVLKFDFLGYNNREQFAKKDCAADTAAWEAIMKMPFVILQVMLLKITNEAFFVGNIFCFKINGNQRAFS